MNEHWTVAIYVYCTLLLVSFYPVARALLRKVKLHPGGAGFDQSNFSDNSKELLLNHYNRLDGTLIFWKNQAAKYEAFHYYSLFWTIPSAVVIPILTQYVNDNDYSKLFLTLVSSVTAILLSFHSGFKVEENFKGFRHGESEFYDLYRRLLDRPYSFGDTEPKQLDTYFKEVERIRRFVRNTETNNFATLDETRKKIDEKIPDK